ISQLKVTILKPDGTALTLSLLVGTAGGFVDAVTLPVSGTYSITIDPQAAATGSATLTLYDVPSDATAAVTVGGAGATINTSVPGQNGAVTFGCTAGQAVTVHLTGVTYGQVKVSLRNPDGSVLVAPRLILTTSGSFAATTPATGTCTIVLDPNQA